MQADAQCDADCGVGCEGVDVLPRQQPESDEDHRWHRAGERRPVGETAVGEGVSTARASGDEERLGAKGQVGHRSGEPFTLTLASHLAPPDAQPR